MLRCLPLGPRARLLSIAALLAAPVLSGCTSHRSIFQEDAGTGDAGEDAGPSDGGPSDGGPSDGGPSDAGSSTLVSIRIAGLGNGPLQIGTSVSLHVFSLDVNGNQAEVTGQSTLTSSAPGVASLSGATLTAVARGTSIIQASLPISGGAPLQAAASVTVQGANSGNTVSVQVTPATLSLAPGLGAQLAANATQGDGSQLSVTAQAHWTSSDATLCTVDDAAQKGFVTAVAVGACTVTAAYGGKSGTAAVSIKALSPTALAVAPATATIAAGATAQLTATATLSDGSVADATRSAVWSTSDSGKATVTGGLVTGAATGSATLTATLGALTASAAITVTAATLKSLSIDPGQATVAAGLTQRFTATAVYSDGTTADATALASWQSDAPAVAALDAATAGLFDALTPGRANITATLSGVTGHATINVSAATATRITLTPSPLTLPAGVSQQVTARALFSDNTVRNVSSDVTWGVGNSALATVSASGLVTGLAAGSTQLTASLGAVTATDDLTITAAQLAQILVLPQNSSVNVGGAQQLTATGIYGDNSLHDVTELATWTSAAPAIALVSNSAGARGLATGVAPGTATITASVGAITSSPASINVSAAALVSIALNPRRLLTAVYITVPTQVIARYADGSQVDVTAQSVFTSADGTIASVVAAGPGAGQVTGVGQGQTDITATFGGQSSSVQATVVAATLQSITVSQGRGGMGGMGGGNNGPINVGQSVQLTASAQFQGAPIGIDVTTLVTWSSSDQSVGQFLGAPAGTFTALAPGNTTAAAELNGISGTLALTVSNNAPTTITVSPATFTLPIGVTRALVATGTYADGSSADVTRAATWSSDANAVAVVGNSALLKGLTTAVSAGTAHITAALGSASGQATITATGAAATTITVTPLDPVVQVGGGGGGGRGGAQKVFYATAHFDDGTNQDVTQSCVWTSSNPSVATISDQASTKGVATVVAAGVTTITASFRALSDHTSLTAQ